MVELKLQSSTQALMNYEQKNYMVLKLYWICAACVVALQVLYFAYFSVTYGFADKPMSMPYYIRMFIAVPSVILVLLGLLMTFVFRVFGKKSSIVTAGFMLAGHVLFVNVVTCVHYGVSVIFVSYVFPIILSLYYNNRKMTLFTSFFLLVSYAAVVTAYLPTRNQEFVRHDIADMVAMPVIIALVTLSGMRVLDIFGELIDKIIEQTIKKIELEREAKEDSLTKLYNHAVFYDSLDFAIGSFEDIPTPFCIIVMDIDNFKSVNDLYGHAFGDLVLINFADVIRSRLSENDMAFRYGGEEFSVISFRTLDATVRLAEEIRVSFGSLSLDANPGASFSVSLGVSMYSKKFGGKREFFSSADNALYEAKKRGKNQTVVALEGSAGVRAV